MSNSRLKKFSERDVNKRVTVKFRDGSSKPGRLAAIPVSGVCGRLDCVGVEFDSQRGTVVRYHEDYVWFDHSLAQTSATPPQMQRYIWDIRYLCDGRETHDGCRVSSLESAQKTATYMAKTLGYKITRGVRLETEDDNQRGRTCVSSTCPECRGIGEVLLLNDMVPCSLGCKP